MSGRIFIDTNIWVYAHLNVANNPKSSYALSLLESLPVLVGSTQVLNEYYSVMLKNKIADRLIQDNIEMMIGVTEIQLIQLSTLRSAHQLKLTYRFSYWDSLILASALEANCVTIYSEDMQDGQMIENQLEIVNPFKERT